MKQNSSHTHTHRKGERERERLGIRDQIKIRHELKDLRVNLIITCNYYHIVISRNENKNKKQKQIQITNEHKRLNEQTEQSKPTESM